jgi:limonene-1,2-epoxide hydrolase
MTTPEQLVREFCAAWSRLDIDELVDYFTDDAVYHNIPGPGSGKEAVRKTIEGSSGAGSKQSGRL